MLIDLPPLEPEFEEYVEFQDIEKKKIEDIVVENTDHKTENSEEIEKIEEEIENQDQILFNPDLIAVQENRNELIAYLQDPYHPEPLSEELDQDYQILFERYVKKGMTVVEYGTGNGSEVLALANLVGEEGKVIAFESRPELFRQMYWLLVNNRVKNVTLYFTVLTEKEKTFDSFEFENISVMRINAQGREDIFLKGAKKAISENKPVLFLNMLGGIPIEVADRFVRQEFHIRLGQIHKMGYLTQRIKGSEYLALPESYDASKRPSLN